MYIFKNALVSITRNKGRNILMGIVILVIAISTSVSLAIKNTANSLVNSYIDNNKIEATIGFDRKNMMNNFDKEKPSGSMENMKEMFDTASSITIDDVITYGDSEYVSNYYYEISVNLNSDDIEQVNSSFVGKNGNKIGREETNNKFTLTGYSSYEAMNNFINGNYSIIEGNIFSDLNSYECIINSELASLNEIEIGDKIKFYNTDEFYEFTVVGIYSENENSSMQMFSESANNIIVGSNILKEIIEKEELNITVKPTFILKNKDVIDSFSSELYDKGMNEYLTLSTNLDQIESSVSSISNVSKFATTFLVTTLLIGSIILFVINMINIRERKYEIGVLRAIGMKKSKIMIQFISELLIVAIISLLCGALIGSLISVPISNSLLENEIASSSSSKEEINKNFGNKPGMNFENINGITNVQAFEQVDAVVDAKVLIQLLGIGILLTFISSIAAISSIQKFSPLDILKERS